MFLDDFIVGHVLQERCSVLQLKHQCCSVLQLKHQCCSVLQLEHLAICEITRNNDCCGNLSQRNASAIAVAVAIATYNSQKSARY